MVKPTRVLDTPGRRGAYQIGALYMPAWQVGAPGLANAGNNWATLASFPLAHPLKGDYPHEGSVALMNEQLAEMARHGLSFVVFNWFHETVTGKPGNVLLNHALDAYLKADGRLRSRVKFAINWITHQGLSPASEVEWEACYEDWAVKYFRHPDYLYVKGRPALWVFESDFVRQNALGTSSMFISYGNMRRAATVDPDTNVITITDGGGSAPVVGTAEFPTTGLALRLYTAGTLPTGLPADANAPVGSSAKLYAIKTGQYTGRVASNQGNALATVPIPIDITSAGVGQQYVNLGLNWPTAPKTLNYLYEKMFAHCVSEGIPKPVVLTGGAFPTPFWYDAYEAAGIEGTSPYNYVGAYVEGSNANKTYSNNGNRIYPNNFAELAQAYEENTLKNFRDGRVPMHVPNLCVGWDNTPWSGPAERVAIGTIGEIRTHFVRMKTLMDAYPEECQGMATVTWNEFAEGNYAEPSERYGHGILRAVRDVFL